MPKLINLLHAAFKEPVKEIANSYFGMYFPICYFPHLFPLEMNANIERSDAAFYVGKEGGYFPGQVCQGR